jgi:hypothetical protein
VFFFECFGCTPAAPVCSEGLRPVIAVLLKGSELAKPMDGAVTYRGHSCLCPQWNYFALQVTIRLSAHHLQRTTAG